MSGQKTLDVDIWMLTRLSLLHLRLPGFIKHCQSLHTRPAVGSPSKEKWDFIAPSRQQGIHMRTLIDRYIKIYVYTHTHKIYFTHLFMQKKNDYTKRTIQKICFLDQFSFWGTLFNGSGFFQNEAYLQRYSCYLA